MLAYPSAIDLSSRTLRYLSRQLAARQCEIRTRWRRLTPGRQALLAVAHLRCGDIYAQLASGFGIEIATAFRCIRGAVDVLAVLAPTLAQAMRTIRAKAFVILNDILLPIDRIAADTPYCSGKHKRHGVNVQVLTDPFGRLLWASPALPGSVHDLTAGRHHGAHRRAHRRGPEVLGGQGVPRRRQHLQGPIPRPSEEVEAPSQHQSRQDPLRQRTGHGHPQGLAPPSQAPPQHQPDHRYREGHPRSSPRIDVRLENAPYALLRDVVNPSYG